jgi:S1-C subfamily serine protease
MKTCACRAKAVFAFIAAIQCCGALLAAELPATIAAVKPSIVGIASYEKTRSPPIKLVGTGFVIGDGLTIITNAHVSSAATATENETLGVIVGRGEQIEFRPASLVAADVEHDLARLKIGGKPLPAVELADSGKVVEGQAVAFTGLPLGMVLGMHPVTHRGIVSAIVPIVIPASDSRRLDPRTITQLRKSPFIVFQLDATAYPGNSGSPLYDPETGTVYGVISMVALKGLKETAISNPSGITYAVPSAFIRDLMQRVP